MTLLSIPCDDTVVSSTQAVEVAYRECRDKAIAIVSHILHHRVDAEDLVQEAFLRAQTNINTFRGECALTTWIIGIAINLALKQSRRARLRTTLATMFLGEEEVVTETPEQLAQVQEQHVHLSKALQTLPERQRVVFLLRYVHDFSLNEIASCLHLSLPTVKTHLLRAMKRLRHELKEVLHAL